MIFSHVLYQLSYPATGQEGGRAQPEPPKSAHYASHGGRAGQLERGPYPSEVSSSDSS
jgi:hypothetical protein